LSFYFPQILIANYASSKPYKKKLLLKTALIQRAPWPILAFITYYILSGLNSTVGLIVFFFFFFLAGFGGSINYPGWYDLIAKITPVNLRGRLFGIRAILGALLGIFGGWAVKVILSEFNYPLNFTILFCLAFSMMMLSYIFLLILKEDEPGKSRKTSRTKDYIKLLPGILKSNINFRNLLIADSLLTAAATADAFYSINALYKFHVPDSTIGYFTIIAMASTVLCNLLFGYIADIRGHKINLIIAALGTIFACINSIIAGNVNLYLLSFIGSACTVTLISLSRMNLVVELSPDAERPVYIALFNLITSPFALIGVLTGWISNYYGYNIIFIICCLIAFCSAVWLSIKVKEPRKINNLIHI
jgi:MFS family permease